MEKKVYLTLDLEQDYGTALHTKNYFSLPILNPLLVYLEKEKIPLTIFIQGKLIEDNVIDVDFFSYNIDIEIEPHSFSHFCQGKTDMKEEIEKSISILTQKYNIIPIGYRFPDGNILPKDYTYLQDNNIIYDASIFPSWRPGRFNNSKMLKTPHITQNGITEIPFTVLGDRMPIPISLSYFKLVGKYLFLKLKRKMPKRIVYDFHLHDLNPIPQESFKKLPFFYKIIYSRNKQNGFKYFIKFIEFCKNNGYKFDTLKNYYLEIKNGGCSD